MPSVIDPTVIDCKLALEQAEGNEDLAKELLQMLLDELPKLKQLLLQALEQNDKTASWDHTHKLYGSTAYTGVPGLRAAAYELEQAIKQEDAVLIQDNFEVLSEEIDRVLACGRDALGQNWN